MSQRYVRLRLPSQPHVHPALAIAQRLGIAIVIVLLNWFVVIVERDGYHDSADGVVSIADALYYTTVTLSTTGYGDITPISTGARLTNTLLVTPMRFLFVLVLIGTTIQVLTERSRDEFKIARWRSRVKDHVIVLGYGTKGRSAVRSLLQRDTRPDHIVVIDSDPHCVEEARAAGFSALLGSATDDAVLRAAVVDRAFAVIVAVNRDDTAVLATLSVRSISPEVTVVASVREEENADLLRRGGADAVITSSAAAGRLLGLATDSPRTVAVLEDMLSFGHGLDILERLARPEEIGRSARELGVPVLAVVRSGHVLAYDEEGAGAVRSGDRLIFVGRGRPNSPGAAPPD